MATTIIANGQSFIRQAGHCLVRKDALTLYCIVLDGALESATSNVIKCYKSDDNGANWTSVGTGPSGAQYYAPSACIDSTGLIRIVYHNKADSTGSIRYVEFDTATDSFQNDALAFTLVSFTSPTSSQLSATDCAIGNDRLHVAVCNSFGGHLAFKQLISYSNRTSGGTWASRVTVGSTSNDSYYPYIFIGRDSQKLPYIANIFIGGADAAYSFLASVGNTENATSFTTKTIATQVTGLPGGALKIGTWYNTPAILQRADGDIFYVYVGNVGGTGVGNKLCFSRHRSALSWSTWDDNFEIGSGTKYLQAGGHVRGYGKIVADENAFAGGWGSDPTNNVDWGSSYNNFEKAKSVFTVTAIDNENTPTWVKPRCANYWEPAESIVDLAIEVDGNVYYDRVDLNRPV